MLKLKIIKNIFTGTLLLLGNIFFAQQESLFTSYRYNMNLINPAYVGLNGETIITGTFRSQWSGIEDAPETQAISFGTPLGKHLGIGVSMIYDKTFIEKRTLVGLDISYKIQVGSLSDFYFGIKAGGSNFKVNTFGLKTYTSQSDPALNSINQFNPNIGFGALLTNEKYYVSFSVPRLLNTKSAKNKNGYAYVATDRPHMYVSGGYNLDLKTRTPLVLKPSFILRYVNAAPISIDIGTMLEIEEFFQIGGSFRIDKAYAGIVGLTINRLLMVGYVYEINYAKSLANTNNTNEFFLRFKF